MDCKFSNVPVLELYVNQLEAEILMNMLMHIETPISLDSSARDFKTALHFNLKTFLQNIKREQHE